MRERRVTTLIILLVAISLLALGLTFGDTTVIAKNYLEMIFGA